jgi:U3 small nucleolar ribonucleoprotein protein IMP4
MPTKQQTRLRSEYLFKRSKQAQLQTTTERKARLNSFLSSNKPIPNDLKTNEAQLRASALWDDAAERPDLDDEYATHRAPRVCVTTSRDPSSKLKEFAKEIRLLFPTGVRVNRGQTTLPDLMDSCRAAEFTDVVLCTEHRGEADGLIISHLPYGPTLKLSLSDCVTRHDIGREAAGNASEAVPHLIFHDFASKLGVRVKTIIQNLFPSPKPDTKRILTFFNRNDIISFRHHLHTTTGGGGGSATTTLQEVGPRMEMTPYEIKLGTMDQNHAESEWALRSYTNNAKRRRLLGGEEEHE